MKNILLTSEQTFDRKIKEGILAIKVDRDIGKERVLEIYLNHIYFGSGAYGVAVAAETYFGKSLNELNLEEAALLAGLPKAPSSSNPFVNPAKALERRNYVIHRMKENGYISAKEESDAISTPLNTVEIERIDVADPAMWYAQEAIRRQVLEENGAKYLYEGGDEITSTVDSRIQRVIHKELRHHLVIEDRKTGWRGPLRSNYIGELDWSSAELSPPSGAEDWVVGVVVESGRDAMVLTRDGEITLAGNSLGWATSKKRADAILKNGDVILLAEFGNGFELVQLPTVQGAVVVMDPRDGSILGLAGGFSGETSEFDRASQAKRQTGSVFKPFVYLAAIEAGYNAVSPVLDSPIAIDQGAGMSYWRPNGGASGGLGMITLRRALEQSRNLATVRLLYDLGLDPVVNVAVRAGFSLPETSSYSVALGAAEATPIEVATAYSAIANGGYHVNAKLIPGSEQPNQVFEETDVAKLTSIMEGVIRVGTARRAFSGFDKPLAGKTGTTNGSRDAWFAAYGAEVVIVAWIGRDNHTPIRKGAAGGTTTAPLVRSIADGIVDVVNFVDFVVPHGLEVVKADRKSGSLKDGGDVDELLTVDEVQDVVPQEVDEYNYVDGDDYNHEIPDEYNDW